MLPLGLRPPIRSSAPRSASDLSQRLGATDLCFARSVRSPFAAATMPSRFSSHRAPTRRHVGGKASVLLVCQTQTQLARPRASIRAEVADENTFDEQDLLFQHHDTSFPGRKHPRAWGCGKRKSL